MNFMLVYQADDGQWVVARITRGVDHFRRPIDFKGNVSVYRRISPSKSRAEAVRKAKDWCGGLEEEGCYVPPILIQERARNANR